MKRFLKAPTLSCVVVALFAALLLKGGIAEATPMQSYGTHSIDAGAPPFKTLNAVVEVSARNIWAVGTSFSLSNPVERTLIEHWDGTAWSIVPSPNPTTTHDTSLNGVAEVSANDVWAVGSSTGTLIEHWNGKQWSIVASPNPPGSTGSLSAVAEVSAHDIWAVGGSGQTLIEHWNGEQWSIVASPNPAGATGSSLNGVTEVSAHNAWAVGDSFSNSSGRFSEQTLIEHWNGKQWSIVPSPNPTGSNDTVLKGVAEVSARNVWAVGSSPEQTLTEHWNGEQWSIVPSPNQPSGGLLNGVTEVSAHNVWAVGGHFIIVGDERLEQTLIEHWNGKQWSIVTSPNVSGSTNDSLNGVEEVSARNIWAVGVFFTRSAGGLPLIEHWDGVQWSIVPGAD
jgi:hypothetical protein